MQIPASKILVFEDDQRLLSQIQELSVQLDKCCVLVQDKQEFMDTIMGSVMAIVMNISMPGFDAFEATVYLEAVQCAAPVVLTGRAGEPMLPFAERFAQDRGLNVVGVLTKPFREDSLADMMGRALEKPHNV